MQQTAELRRQSRPFPRQGPGVRVTWEQACAFLDSLEEHGYMPSTVENYRRNLKHFFQKLPRIRRWTPAPWTAGGSSC